MLLLAFAVYLPIFSIMGADSLKDFVLPALALAIPTSAGTIRVFRSSLLDGYNSDFVLYARARGVSEWKIANMVSRFALPPLITMLAQSFGFMIAGSSMVESVFSIPGLGSMLVTALNARDTITINACVLFSHPELLVYPGLCILFAAAGFNLFGEALRDLCAPKEGS